MKILIVNGPNLNLLGRREPGIYGQTSFDDFLPQLRQRYPDVEIDYFQSNIEGVLIDKMQQEGFSCDGIVLNAGAYTHTASRRLSLRYTFPTYISARSSDIRA